MTTMDDPETERGFDSRIIAGISTPSMVAQVLDLEVPPDRELVLCERTSTIALQRQVRQNFAEGRFECEGGPRRFDDIGRLMFVPAMTPLRIKYEGRNISIVRCMFPKETFDETIASEGAVATKQLRNCLNIKSAPIRSLMMSVAREIENKARFTDELVECYGQILTIELKRYFDLCAADGGISRGGMSTGALRKVIERIEADTIPPSLEELAALTGLSKRHLTRSFRQSTGQTILEKINESRFNRANLAIAHGEKNLSEVARMSGYDSLAAFSQAYKKWFGKSPTKYSMP
ncbi:hypothetical protein C7W88_21465 (plasmid) [Novosphingobium sp. THN1]|jgi:AraC family transcriptional regulator|uniref:helix-turn-helix transcriptional regulator n=1 Tax=Novosphingobium sp. THN1 TaxID=1016987 RepID=UPI000E473FA9|nr:helix-turn-helix transcriptional regulator [Novosphingobium sp. THN1]AXU21431.1 hypothetical protein C7W88_21465 [Novosphingobium sp. THN1]